MRKNAPLYALIFLFALAAVAGIGAAFKEHAQLQQAAFEHRKLALLETENARLRGLIDEQEKAREKNENITRRAEIERATSRIRQLPFKQRVTYDVLTRGEIQKVISQKIGAQFSDAEIKNAGLALAAFGLLPRDYPLKEKYVELLGEQVAAFYDQHQHKLFMFEDATLSSPQNRVILSHELTHALQDQNFGLLKLPLEIKDDDDRSAAASALIEGDATLEMTQYMAQDFSLQSLRETVTTALTQNMEQLLKAPRYLRETLVFPYLEGQKFCAAILARGGWQALDETYKNPPSSTSQILHPEKFFANEQPVAIDFGNDLTALGEKPIEDNVLGELATRILISQYVDMKKAASLASGWRGDRYLAFKNGDALIWKSEWESDEKAREFSVALRAHIFAREKAQQPGAPNPIGSFAQIHSDTYGIFVSGNQIVFIQARDAEWAAALAGKFAPQHLLSK